VGPTYAAKNQAVNEYAGILGQRRLVLDQLAPYDWLVLTPVGTEAVRNDFPYDSNGPLSAGMVERPRKDTPLGPQLHCRLQQPVVDEVSGEVLGVEVMLRRSRQ
jgi:hypothetical protein